MESHFVRTVTELVLFVGVVMLFASGCRVPLDSKYNTLSPRNNAQSRIVVLDSDDDATQALLAGLRENQSLDEIVKISEDEQRRFITQPRTWPGWYLPVCAEMIRRNADYVAIIEGDLEYSEDTVCEEKRRGTSAEEIIYAKRSFGRACAKHGTRNEQTTATLDYHVFTARNCAQGAGNVAPWQETVHGERSLSYPAAQSKLRQKAHRSGKNYVFPRQATLVQLGSDDRGTAPDASWIKNGQVLRTFRGTRFIGGSQARRTAQGELAVRPLSCCYQPRPGDKVTEQGTYRLVDFGLGLAFGSIKIGDEYVPTTGVHYHLRTYSVVGGFIWGFGGDSFFRDRATVSFYNAEVGYQLRPLPGVEVIGLFTNGVGVRHRGIADTKDVGMQLGALLGVTWTPYPWWHVGLELASSHTLFGNIKFVDPSRPLLSRILLGVDF